MVGRLTARRRSSGRLSVAPIQGRTSDVPRRLFTTTVRRPPRTPADELIVSIRISGWVIVAGSGLSRHVLRRCGPNGGRTERVRS